MSKNHASKFLFILSSYERAKGVDMFIFGGIGTDCRIGLRFEGIILAFELESGKGMRKVMFSGEREWNEWPTKI